MNNPVTTLVDPDVVQKKRKVSANKNEQSFHNGMVVDYKHNRSDIYTCRAKFEKVIQIK